MQCGICGRNIYGNISVDHIFPRALYKWYPGNEELKNDIESSANKMYTHTSCNNCKEDARPDISSLRGITDEQRQALNALEKKHKAVIDSYYWHKRSILKAQGNRCLGCGMRLSYEKGVLRRINPKKPRAWENACIVCHSCNLKKAHFEARKKAAANTPDRV